MQKSCQYGRVIGPCQVAFEKAHWLVLACLQTSVLTPYKGSLLYFRESHRSTLINVFSFQNHVSHNQAVSIISGRLC